MCGLFGGISTSLIANEMDNIIELGITAQLRGRDSTGVALAYHEKKKDITVDVIKSVDHSSNFLWRPPVIEAMYKYHPFLVAGHCRAATLGEVNADNAHPFSLGRIVGMHNGTVTGIRGKHKDGTDSEALLTILRDEGLQAAVNEARHGAYALVWIDHRDHTLNFIRNGMRPLYHLTARGVLYWSSEYDMLKLMAGHAQLEGTPHLLPADIHLSCDLHYPISNQERVKVAPASPVWQGYATPIEKKNDSAAPPKKAETSVPVTVPRLYEADDTQTSVLYKGFKGKRMKLGKARHLLNEGCAHCTAKAKDVPIKQSQKAYFFNNKAYLCGDCAISTDARAVNNAKELYLGELLVVGGCHGSC